MSTALGIQFKQWPCSLIFDQYRNGQMCINLIHATEGDPIATATVAMDVQPDAGCVWIKDYSENEGMLACLEESGLLKATGKILNNGYVDVIEAMLLLKTCPQCKLAYVPAKDPQTNTEKEQHISGICSDSCWDAAMGPAEED